jgi:hypothetical protein
MIPRFGTDPAQTRAPFGDTLTAGGGWTCHHPGWGCACERVSGRAR